MDTIVRDAGAIGKKLYSMIEQQQTILISGYYGFGNTGDEAVLAAMISDLQSACPGVDICVISGDPAETQKQHQVKAVPIDDLQTMVSEVKRSDLAIIGGGGLFHDYWGVDLSAILTDQHHGLALYSSLALLTGLLNKPLMIYGVGVGPLQTEQGKQITRAVFETARTATVRDHESKVVLCDLGLDPDKITVTADPSFRWLARNHHSPVSPQISAPEPYLGIALRNWNLGPASHAWEGQVADAVDDYLELYEGSVVFIPFQVGEDRLSNDLEIANRIHRQLRNRERAVVLNPDLSPGAISSVISACDVLLGMRLHSIIFAALNEVPVVGLGYDPKIFRTMRQLGIEEYALPLEQLNRQVLLARLEKAVRNAPGLREQLGAQKEGLKTRAWVNTQEAVRLLHDHRNTSSPPDQAGGRLSEALFNLVVDSSQEKDRRLVDAVSDITSLQDEKLRLERLVRQERNAHRVALRKQQEKYSQLAVAWDQERTAHREQAQAYESRISHLGEELDHQKKLVEGQKARIDQAEKELSDIKSSRGWKVLWLLWEIRNFLIPKGSQFEKTISGFWQGLSRAAKRIVHPFRSAKSRRVGWGMSKYEFAFDQYKRARSRKYTRDLSALRLPSIPGLVSVVLPVYNGEAYLAEAVESILAQTYQHFELIIINDGSEDRTARILEKYQAKDQRIKVIHQENRKLPLALSRGFNLARGEFLTWTSHDNRLRPDFLDRMVLSLREHPEWDMVYANQDLIDEAGAPLRGSAHYRGYERPSGSEHIKLPLHTGELNTRANNFIGGAFLYRDRVHWLLGDFSPLRFTREDYDYWMRVNALLTLKHTPFQDAVYEYRFHPHSLTHRDQDLGITRDRKNLMVFDDFRRDFYLSPIIWVIEADPALDGQPRELSVLISEIEKAGHVILDRAALDQYNLPTLWLPIVYLYASDTLEWIPDPPQELPGSAINVFMSIAPDQPLPEEVGDGWDICLAYDSNLEPARLDKIRQGWMVSDDIPAILTAIDIRVRSDHLEKIEHDLTAAGDDQVKISVIICTYNRPGQLADTLRSIAYQTMAEAEFEVIIVNNQPGSPAVEEAVQAVEEEYFQDYPSHIRVMDCPLTGLSQARNAGLSEAKGELLYFIDDDAAAEPNTLEVYADLFSEHPTAGVIGGQILFKPDQELPRIWREGWEKYWSHFSVESEQFQTVENWWEFPWGANWCARKTALKRIGGFRTGYGRRGEDFSGGEEIVAASLIKRLGYSIGITPQAVVTHQIDESRISLQHIKRTMYAGLLTAYQAEAELRLYPEGSSRTTLGGLRRFLDFLGLFLRARREEKQAVMIETAFFIHARGRMLIRKTRDAFKHFQRPLTAK